MVRDIIPWRKKRQPETKELGRYEGHPLMELQRDMDELFDSFFTSFGSLFPHPAMERLGSGLSEMSPRVDVSEDDKDITVSAELPGLDEQDISVDLEDNQLTIRGEKKNEREEKQKDYVLTERSYGHFERVVALPAEVQQDQVKASFKKGVLTITLPKSPEAQSKRRHIAIEG